MPQTNVTPERAEYKRKWQRENRDRAYAAQKRWIAKPENKKKVAETIRVWKLDNPNKVKLYRTKWRLQNREHQLMLIREWRKANPDKCKEYKLRWRARCVGTRIEGRIIRKHIKNYYSRICGICDKKIDGSYDLDHIIPLSRGGIHSTDNLQLAHPFCNRSKFNKLTEELTMVSF